MRLWNGAVERHFTVRDGLPSNAVVGVRADRTEGVWVLTTRGLCYIHTRDGKDEVLLAADSAAVGLTDEVLAWGFDLASVGVLLKVAPQGGVWWSTGPRGSTQGVLHRVAYTPSGVREVQRLCFDFGVSNAWPVGSGLLVRGNRGPLLHYPADGPGRALDPRFTGFLGVDFRSRVYLASPSRGRKTMFLRDDPAGGDAFGAAVCAGRFLYPTEVSDAYGDFHPLGEGMWASASAWRSGQPVLALGEDHIAELDAATYPFTRVASRFAAPDRETAWVLPWGQRQLTELRFVPGVEYATRAQVNGLWPLHTSPQSDRHLFVVDPGPVFL